MPASPRATRDRVSAACSSPVQFPSLSLSKMVIVSGVTTRASLNSVRVAGESVSETLLALAWRSSVAIMCTVCIASTVVEQAMTHDQIIDATASALVIVVEQKGCSMLPLPPFPPPPRPPLLCLWYIHRATPYFSHVKALAFVRSTFRKHLNTRVAMRLASV